MDESREGGLAGSTADNSLRQSRDCVTCIQPLFFQIVATRGTAEVSR